MDQLVIEVVPVSLVLCVSSIPKGAHETMSPTHGSNWDARTKRPDDDESNGAHTPQLEEIKALAK